MNPQDKIEKKIQEKLSFSASDKLRERILKDVLNAHNKSTQTQAAHTPPNIWSNIMKNSITKFAAAAAMIILAIVFSITILNQTATPVWAIGQTIKAIEGFEAIYSSGVFSDENGNEFEVEFWAKPNKNGTGSGDMRMETKGGPITVVNEEKNITYKYDPGKNVVLVQKGIRFYCRPWADENYFIKMKEACSDWKEEYRTGQPDSRDIVLVTARNIKDNQSYEFQFDLESKLPICGKVWQNSDFKGKPNVTSNEIVYNPALPNGIFEFDIPEGASVIEE